MPDERDVPGAALPGRSRVLPPEALAGLEEAFADEVSERLPRLLEILDGPPGPDALRDAHSLGSSAAVMGEPDASRTARALEAELAGDAPDLDRCRALVRELADRLGSWAAA